MEFTYNAEDLHETPCGSDFKQPSDYFTTFDRILTSKWNEAVENGIFKYTLEDCEYKLLSKDGWHFVVQLNPQRAFKRRKREEFSSMNAPFSDSQFNFKKIKPQEIILRLNPGKNTACLEYDDDFSYNDHVLVVNVSPIDNCHVLLIPQLNEKLPQKVNVLSLLIAFDLVQLSGHPGFRLGFNSLHAWASVNHLHYHGMYLNYPLPIDNILFSYHVKSHCYVIDDCPLPALAFKIPMSIDKRVKVATEIQSVVEMLHEREIPYNALITRGEHGTRFALFPRTSAKGHLSSLCFDVACVEVGGQLPIKSEEEFKCLTYDKAFELLQSASLKTELFLDIVNTVRNML